VTIDVLKSTTEAAFALRPVHMKYPVSILFTLYKPDVFSAQIRVFSEILLV
jgi:hypothetical protein